MRWLQHILACAGLLVAAGTLPAHAQQNTGSPVVADLSESLISITTGFIGTEVLLFGATDGAGDVIVVVRAPHSQVIVRRKERVGGIWVNTDSLMFDKVPGFYHVASTAPLADLLSNKTLMRENIGTGNLAITPTQPMTAREGTVFRQALIRNKQAADLFYVEPGKVDFLGNRLFRTRVSLPSNVPIGKYRASVYLVRDGQIVGRTETPLQVRKAGFEAAIFEFAHMHSAWYGLVAVAIALAGGWFAGLVFRKV